MKLQRIFEHYREEMNYEVLWDIMLFDTENPNKKVVVKEPVSRFWGADPFLFVKDGRKYLFYEQYDRKKKKGVIAYREITNMENYTLSEPYVVIEEDFHMSFPFIFQRNDEIYIIPETSSVGEIRLYRAECFPNQWVYVKTIVSNFPGVDTIVLQNKEKLILHTSVGDSCNVENYILECDKDFSCVRKDKIKDYSERGNRNAGKIVKRNGKEYRIGQDCSGKEYGKGLIAYELTSLSSEVERDAFSFDRFLETEKYCGVHTYNECDGTSVIDLKYLKPKPIYKKFEFIAAKTWRAIIRKVKRIFK